MYQGFGHTQLVDPVAYRGQVLAYRVVTDFALLGIGQRQAQHLHIVTAGRSDLEFIVLAGNGALGCSQLSLIGKTELQRSALLWQAAIANTLIPKQGAQLAVIDIHAGFDGLFHVHLQQEVHTTSEIETELHRSGANIQQPIGCRSGQVLGDHEIVAQRAANDVLGRQLIRHADQPHQTGTGVAVELGTLGLDTGLVQGLLDAPQVALFDGLGRAGTGNLDSWIVRIEIGCGVDQAEREHSHDKQIFPQGITVEHVRAR